VPSEEQIALPFAPSGPSTLGRVASSSEPLLWVRRLRLWRDIADAPLRDVRLHRGLNIIWSPAGEQTTEMASGHAAGKTLFCRLMRYCLGEGSFAGVDDTAAIRRHCPRGGVAAEVRVGGETWCVRRTFFPLNDDRAARVSSLEELTDDVGIDGFNEFEAAIGRTLFNVDAAALLSQTPRLKQPWLFMLAWLTRDQECRADGLLHWRHPESSSSSPARGAGPECLTLLRVALGLYSKESAVRRQLVDDLRVAADQSEAARRSLESRIAALVAEIAIALGRPPEAVWPPPAGLLEQVDATRAAHIRSLMELADEQTRAVGSVKSNAVLHSEIAKRASLVAALGSVADRIRRLTSAHDSAVERVRLNENAQRSTHDQLRKSKHPSCPYDDAPLDVEASRFRCPLVRLPDVEAARRLVEESKVALDDAIKGVGEVEAQLAHARRQHATLGAECSRLTACIDQRQAASAAMVAASQKAWAAKGSLRRLPELAKEVEAARLVEADAKDRLRKAQEAQASALAAYSTRAIESWFNRLVSRIVATAAEGEICLDGKGLHSNIHWRGRRRSVALNSLRVTLFDLSAMLCAAEGGAASPAFLVHDSPREGDLDRWTYERLFDTLFDLDPGDDQAPFQYIVTTTTDPPLKVRSSVRLVLRSDTPAERLFKADL